jgi:hypothetical protein
VPFIAGFPLAFLQFRNNPFSLHPECYTGNNDNPGGNYRIKGTDATATAATEPEDISAATRAAAKSAGSSTRRISAARS